MKKQVLMSMMAIGITALLVGSVTFAYFSDTETSSGNSFTAGTLDLKTSHSSQEPWSDGVTATWTLSDMKPGDETSTGSVYFKNDGSISADHMQIACNYIVTEEDPQTESDTDPNTNEHPDTMAKNMTITMMVYRNDNVNINCLTGYDSYSGQTKEDWKVSDTDGDGKITLYDLNQDPLDNIPSPDSQPNGITQVDMRLKFDENAGNDFQGDTFDLTMIFTLNQDSSQ